MIDETFLIEAAQLAYISLESEEIDGLRADCTKIMSFLDDLKQVDVSDVEPMVTPWTTQAPLREDVSQHPNILGDILKNAPCALDGCFAIPKFVA